MSALVVDHMVPQLQEFMKSSGEQGVLLIALGTVTETSEPAHHSDLPTGRHVMSE